ncbi:MAG: hypothetical protein IPP56_13770 [Bacteroidetes bacterium]|nr:hypothetical protein [Bacteroidota bacterium]
MAKTAAKKVKVKLGRKKLPKGEKKVELRFYIEEKFVEKNGGKEKSIKMCEDLLGD